MRRGAHRGESGQAMLLALLVLFLASVAAGFVATDLSWRERALQEEAARAHLRALLDGVLAESLARVEARLPADVDEERAPGPVAATVAAESEELDADHLRVRVRATYAGRRGAAEAIVLRYPRTLVLAWRRVPPG